MDGHIDMISFICKWDIGLGVAHDALLMIPAFYFEMKPLKGGLTTPPRGGEHIILS